MPEKYETVIGLEIHIQLKTKSKMFCGSDNRDTLDSNVCVCPICTGHPGVLPVINQQALHYAVLMAKALNCQVLPEIKFDRKNYFYPDLPKGYQISQYDLPLARNGWLEIENEKIRINRVHLEEDAAKNIHTNDGTLVDFNRAGTPLLEIVTESDIHSPGQAKVFLQELQKIARYLDISEADMEKGHLRCDANISLRPMGDEALYCKTEIKNLNSFRSVERALAYEIERQTDLWQRNQAPEEQSTRGWNEKETIPQRTKEESADYRYFPEPDLPPLNLQEIYVELPELPQAKAKRFQEEYALNIREAGLLTESVAVADFFEETISELRSWLESLDPDAPAEEIWQKSGKKLVRLVFGYLTSDIFKLCRAEKVEFKDIKITPENLAEFITLIYQNKINRQAAQKILALMFTKGSDPSQIMEGQQFAQISDTAILEKAVEEAINTNPQAIQEYKAGKQNAIMFLVGQVMKTTQGKANPQVVLELLKKKL